MPSTQDDSQISEEVKENEEILFELDECLHSKKATLRDLKEQAENIEKDIVRHTTPFKSETSTLDEDILMFRTVASKYVKSELIDFYAERMRKSKQNKTTNKTSTISALCEYISSIPES